MTEENIRSLLGCKITKKVFTVQQSEYPGWEANLGEARQYGNLIESVWRKFNEENTRLFASSAVSLSPTTYYSPLLIIPEMPVLEIIELSKVGTHNNEETNWKTVLNTLKRIYDNYSFDIQFADEAGLKATFLSDVPESYANEIDAMILDINSEAWDAIDEESIKHLVLKQKRLRLWWD